MWQLRVIIPALRKLRQEGLPLSASLHNTVYLKRLIQAKQLGVRIFQDGEGDDLGDTAGKSDTGLGWRGMSEVPE